MKTSLLFSIAFLLWLLPAPAQDNQIIGRAVLGGKVVKMMLDENGDTLYLANDLLTVSLSSPRTFKSRDDYLRYRRYLRYAAIVYPYAREAIRIFDEVQNNTAHLKKRKRKKYVKKLQRELETEFEEPLKKLTKTQGMILTKMIERETGHSMYELIKSLRGGFAAGYWNLAGKFWGYHLRDGYRPGEDPILDAVLSDFELSRSQQEEP